MPERPRPDLNRVRDALREHDEDVRESEETEDEPSPEEEDDGEA